MSLYATVLDGILDATTIEVRPDDATRLPGSSSTGPACFVSYASTNAAADQIAETLQRNGLPHWFRPLASWFDSNLAEHFRRIIATSDVFLLVLSKGALDRRWVRSEVESATSLHDQRGTPRIIVVRTDSTTLPSSGPFCALPYDCTIDAHSTAPTTWTHQLLTAIAP